MAWIALFPRIFAAGGPGKLHFIGRAAAAHEAIHVGCVPERADIDGDDRPPDRKSASFHLTAAKGYPRCP
jgi:hypothetical protein